MAELYLLVPLLSCLASCGTLFNGSDQTIAFTSEPDGAQVIVNGTSLGTTPFEVSLDSRISHNVAFHLEGYESRVTALDSSIEPGWLILDIIPGFLFGVIPLVMDAATGNWNGLHEHQVHAILEPRQQQ